MEIGSAVRACQQNDLELHAATLSNSSMDWCQDFGASRHFCNDSTRLVSMKKYNISISIAWKIAVLEWHSTVSKLISGSLVSQQFNLLSWNIQLL